MWLEQQESQERRQLEAKIRLVTALFFAYNVSSPYPTDMRWRIDRFDRVPCHWCVEYSIPIDVF